MRLSLLQERLDKLNNVVKIQCLDGSWDYDAYMMGLANGLILAQAIMLDKSPEFKKVPESGFGVDKKSKELLSK